MTFARALFKRNLMCFVAVSTVKLPLSRPVPFILTAFLFLLTVFSKYK